MIIGTMNHPGRDVLKELQWIAEMGFEFVDLTFEPPQALVSRVDIAAVRDFLRQANLQVIGHTAYYLPMCSPFESIRKACVEELKECVAAFGEVGAKWMNIHPDRQAPMHDRAFIIDRNLQSLRELSVVADQVGVGLMIENLPGSFNTVQQLSELLDPMPELGLHLDIGHSNLLTEYNTTDEILKAYGSRLKHVHMHDNKGGSADLHLPLGTGTIDTEYYVRALQAAGYDGTITLEVFTPDKHYLSYSRDVLRRLWAQTAKPRETREPRRAVTPATR
ncbi:MAG TPA: sugar phosphate isomerase/epimerase family protein [Verrucomicrobiae bacterium]|nr:sugar phosphate isomerase/epimerase family protein [Verrucomicrobiae bacterium]